MAKNVKINENCNSGHASGVFWAEALKRMAAKVVGNSFFLTSNAYFSPTSYFGLYELSILLMDKSPSTSLSVLNVNPRGSDMPCGMGSISDLGRNGQGHSNV